MIRDKRFRIEQLAISVLRVWLHLSCIENSTLKPLAILVILLSNMLGLEVFSACFSRNFWNGTITDRTAGLAKRLSLKLQSIAVTFQRLMCEGNFELREDGNSPRLQFVDIIKITEMQQTHFCF